MKLTTAESDIVAQAAAALALERAGTFGTYRRLMESEFVDAMLAGLLAHPEPLTAEQWAEAA